MRVSIVQRYVPQYRVALYWKLRELLRQRGIDLHLVYGQPDPLEAARGDAVEIPWGHRIRNRFVRLGSRMVTWQPCLDATRGSDLIIVEQASRLLVNYVFMAQRHLGRTRLAFWGHGRNCDVEDASRIGEAVKRWTIADVDWWFAYTAETARFLTARGVPQDRITVLQNAIDTAGLRGALEQLTKGDTSSARRELGLGEGPTGLFLGSIYRTKRPEFLVQAADHVRRRLPDFELVVVGDGPDRHVFDAAASTRPWVHVLGALAGASLVRVAATADVMLGPGVVGLNVLDSFVLEVPMITVDVSGHGPEIEYLRDRENGVMLPRRTSPQEYAECIVDVLSRPDLLASLKAGCARSAKRYTIDEMAARFANGIVGALDAVSPPHHRE